MKAVNRVLKIKTTDMKELQKTIISKLSSEKINKKMIYQLIVELDMYLNCIEDNYD